MAVELTSLRLPELALETVPVVRADFTRTKIETRPCLSRPRLNPPVVVRLRRGARNLRYLRHGFAFIYRATPKSLASMSIQPPSVCRNVTVSRRTPHGHAA